MRGRLLALIDGLNTATGWLAAGYTLLKGGHIRTDVFYERWSPKTRASS